MISFFRRALSSWLVLGLLGLIMIAFIVTGVGTPGGLGDMGGGGGAGDTVAKIGKLRLGSVEVTQRVQLAQQNVQQQRPEVDLATFVKGGGADDVVRQLISAKALEAFAREHGIGASKRLVDGDIASMEAFKGPTGQFDEAVYRSVLAQRRLTDAQVRADLTGDAIRRQILLPVGGGSRAPEGLVVPYASLMLEARRGQIGFVPSSLMQGAVKAPTEADVNAWYSRNLALYTVPERRVLRYALISKDQLGTIAPPTEAEITKFYNSNAATYGANESRSFSQVILPDEAAAKALAAKVKGGSTFAAAAQAAGFSPADTALGVQTRAQITELASADVAAAAFSAPKGGITAPIKSSLGWYVLHVDNITQSAGRPLAAVRGEIAAAIEKQKVDEAIADLIAAIEDQVSDGASFDDVVKARKLTVITTPPVLPNGMAPEQPAWKTPPELQVLLKTAFDASPDDDPTVENIGNGELHALLKVGQVIPAAPEPLPRIRERVVNDFKVNQAFERARTVAKAIIAKADSGVPFAKAIADARLNLPPPQPAGGRQIDMAQSKQQVPPPLALMFSLTAGSNRMLEAPDKQGWFLVHLDTIEKGDASKAPGLIEATRGEFNRVLGQEFLQQFVNAVEKGVGVTRNDAAITKLKHQISGAGSQ